MGVTTNTSHNHRNETLLEGCRKLGYSSSVVPQNTGARAEGDDGDGGEVPHLDGYCSNGCGSGKKGQGRKMGTYVPSPNTTPQLSRENVANISPAPGQYTNLAPRRGKSWRTLHPDLPRRQSPLRRRHKHLCNWRHGDLGRTSPAAEDHGQESHNQRWIATHSMSPSP